MGRFKRFTVYTIRVPFAVDFYTAKSRVGTRERPSVWTLIKGETSNGLVSTVGIAEQPQWIAPTQASVYTDMINEICPVLVGRDTWDLPEIKGLVESKVKILNQHHNALIEQLVLDVNAKEAGVPAYKLLGGERKAIEILWTIGAPDPKYMGSEAESRAREGYKRFKIKGNGQEPSLSIEKIRSVVAGVEKAGHLDLVDFTVDWNESFGYDTHVAVKVLRRAEEEFSRLGADLSYMEQPLRENVSLEATAWIQRRVKTNIMLDESVRTPRDIADLASNDLHLAFLKIEKMGGPYTIAWEILPLGKTLGVSMYGGTFTNEPTGTIVAAHVYGRDEVSGPMELNGPHMMSPDFVACFEGWPSCGPTLRVSETPGIGVEADIDALEEKGYILKSDIIE